MPAQPAVVGSFFVLSRGADDECNNEIHLKSPAHPGGFIKHEIIVPLGLSVTAAANVLGVTRAALSALLNERAHLSPEMALRIEKAFGVSMDTMMCMQNSFDLAQTRKWAGEINVAPFKRIGPPLVAGG
jgi:addiction module HigA family antidote